MALILVRHATPDVRPGVASKLWGITESAREDCVLLAHALPERLAPAIYTSDERKAQETAAVIALRRALAVSIDSGFAEVDRPGTWDEDYRALAADYLRGVEHPGWEPRRAVVRRFSAAVERATDGASGGDVVVVSHGLAMSLYLDSVTSIDLVPFWQSLTFPDAWWLDLARGELTRLYSGAPAPGA